MEKQFIYVFDYVFGRIIEIIEPAHREVEEVLVEKGFHPADCLWMITKEQRKIEQI